MSAFMAKVYDDRIEMLSDGAQYDENTGALKSIERKVWHAERLPLAVTGRGASGNVEFVAKQFTRRADEASSVDEALEEIEFLANFYAAINAPCPAFELLVAAISETDGPQLLHLVSEDVYGTGRERYSIAACEDLVVAGASSEADFDGFNLQDGLREAALPIFNNMRRHKHVPLGAPACPAIHAVGGHIDLTIVRRDGCTVERIHVWPEDKVGEKIVPGLRAYATT
ncbi:hypothetical protein [Mesorhizobium sp. SP-1A]|uniref:hypothetical protein n=1 Tax=Mesorhizobium sp. SP-1A TaxID=3077840 RepID=UPI0028F70B8E|nr:hypothetical protein [Mesorhizobium sp. SP-1A]